MKNGGGKHLLIDAYDCEHLSDPEYLKDTVLELVQLIKMKILIQPIIATGAPHLPGYSCFCIRETSHIAIHTFSDTDKIAIDIYSCCDFDTIQATTFLKNRFSIKNIRLLKVVDRI
jgi:S-adenosylmethionine/arginine decarboxylase-like enzyme